MLVRILQMALTLGELSAAANCEGNFVRDFVFLIAPCQKQYRNKTNGTMTNQPYQIYVHIPFCKARCGYCAFSSCTNFALCDEYFSKLFHQIEATQIPQKNISTIFIGGGTPSSVDVQYLDQLFAKLNQKFDLSSVTEITVECNPESATKELLLCLKRNGVTRLSFGLQSTNNQTLKAIGRLHTYEQFLFALDLANQLGFTNINADLILGLPETIQDFQNSVNTVVNLPLTHVSVYALEVYEGSKIAQLVDGYAHTEDDLADMYDYACETLQKHGFTRYEISNFAKLGFKCQHNLGYWQEKRYYGFGPSASGFVGNTRYDNVATLDDYLKTPTENLLVSQKEISLFEQANEFAMLGLRLVDGISLKQFASNYNCDFFQFFPNANNLVERGLLQVVGQNVLVPQEKFYVVNSILCELLTI